MKSNATKLLGLLVAFSAVALTACDDDDDVIIVPDVSRDDAQELMAHILSYETYGLVAQFERIGDEILETQDCEETTTDTATATGGLNNYSFEYTFTEEYTLTCDPMLSLVYSLTGQQDIDAFSYDAQHLVSLAFTATGLEETSPDDVYDGSYNRSGDWQANRSGETYDFTYDSTVQDVRVSKESGKIGSGTSTFVLMQTYSRANVTYTYSGTVVFLSEDQAEVTFDDDGDTFTIDLLDVSIAD